MLHGLLECVCHFWNVCATSGMCVPLLERVCHFWNVCATSGMCVPLLECVCHFWNVCATSQNTFRNKTKHYVLTEWHLSTFLRRPTTNRDHHRHVVEDSSLLGCYAVETGKHLPPFCSVAVPAWCWKQRTWELSYICCLLFSNIVLCWLLWMVLLLDWMRVCVKWQLMYIISE